MEVATLNIRVNAIAPGWIETSMTEPMAPLRPLLATLSLALLGSAATLGLLVRVRRRSAALSIALIAITLAMAFLNDASFIGGLRPFDSPSPNC